MSANPVKSACSGLAALVELQHQILAKINGKFAQLKRLARLLEDTLDISQIIPNPADLLPSIDATLALYNELRSSCPLLNLPAPSTGALDDLRSKLNLAYNNLLQKIDNHAWSRMDELQNKMDELLNKAASYTNNDWISCAQSICAQMESPTKDRWARTLSDFKSQLNVPGKAFSVMNTGQKAKAEQIKELRTQIKALIS